MPVQAGRPLPDGWQVAHRPDGYWLQRRREDGAWEDERGPYTRYQAAYEWWAHHDGKHKEAQP